MLVHSAVSLRPPPAANQQALGRRRRPETEAASFLSSLSWRRGLFAKRPLRPPDQAGRGRPRRRAGATPAHAHAKAPRGRSWPHVHADQVSCGRPRAAAAGAAARAVLLPRSAVSIDIR